MNRALQFGHLLVLLAVIACLGVIGWRAWALSDEMDSLLGDAGNAVGSLNLTLATLNRPCGVKLLGKLQPCGTLAEIGKATVNVGDIAKTAQIQINQSSAVIAKYESTMDGVATDVHGEMASLTKATDAATQTLHGASLDLSTLNDSLAASKPLLNQATITFGHIDAAISDPAIAKIQSNTVSMTDSGSRILGDAAFEADKYAHPPKKKLTFWGAMWAGVEFVHKLEPPIF